MRATWKASVGLVLVAIALSCDDKNTADPSETDPPSAISPVHQDASELSSYMPFKVGTVFEYQVYVGANRPQTGPWRLHCVDSATIGAERLGLFSVRENDQKRSPVAIVETPPTVWFILLPVQPEKREPGKAHD
jgi:hypothetical protein